MFLGKLSTKVFLGLGVLLLIAGGVFLLSADKFRFETPYPSGQVLTRFNEGLSEGEITRIVSSVDATIQDSIKQQNVYLLSFPREISPESMAERLKKTDGVAWAEPNYRYEVSGFLESLAYAAEGEYATASATQTTIVAVIDTGVNPNHSSLAGKVVPGYNFYNNTTDASGSRYGVGYHGTASAGSVVDGSGGADIRIMPLQVNDGRSRWLNGFAILKAIYYAADNGAHIINMSFGSPAYSPEMQRAIDYAHSKGVTLVASAGNDGGSALRYPAAYNNVIAVGAANGGGKLAGFSNFGSFVDVVAPGWGVKGLSWDGTRMVNGTSFSSPFIAGVAALFKSYFPQLTPGEIETQIKSLARNVDHLNPERIGGMGAGFIGLEEVRKLAEALKSGAFRLGRELFPTAPPIPAIPGPWLLMGQTTQGVTYVLQPDGTLVKQETAK